jgi:hypothetical protein
LLKSTGAASKPLANNIIESMSPIENSLVFICISLELLKDIGVHGFNNPQTKNFRTSLALAGQVLQKKFV